MRHDKQAAVFCFAHHTEYTGKGKKKKYETHDDYYMAGIGCYGFMSEQEWLKKKYPKIYAKIDPKYWDDYKYMMSTSYCGDKWGYEWYGIGIKDHFSLDMKVPKPDLDEQWIGVLPETAHAFFAWLKTVVPEEYYNKIDQTNPLRYNQGDAFFAVNLNIPLGATAPGEAQGTIMGAMFKEPKKKKRKNGGNK